MKGYYQWTSDVCRLEFSIAVWIYRWNCSVAELLVAIEDNLYMPWPTKTGQLFFIEAFMTTLSPGSFVDVTH